MNKKNLVKIINKEIAILSDFVEGFNDSNGINSIEIDLALSKARDIYDELLLLKNDKKTISPLLAKPNKEYEDKEIDRSNIPKNIESHKADDSDDETALKSEMVNHEKEEQATVVEELSSDEKIEPELTDNNIIEHAEESLPDNEPEIEDVEHADIPDLKEESENIEVNTQPDKEEAKEELNLPEQKQPEQKNEVKSKGVIVADKFSNGAPSVNDMLASVKKNKNLASLLEDSPIKDLNKAIKLNDRIWYINELFNKNGTTYEKAVDIVNQSPDLDKALEYLFENFSWDQDQKSTISFLELVFRRFAKIS